MAAIAHSVYHPDTPIASYPIPVPATGHKFPGCQLEHPTTASCTMGGVRFILESFPRSMGLYGPLNLIMALAFRYHHLKKYHYFLLSFLVPFFFSSFLSDICILGIISFPLVNVNFSYLLNYTCAFIVHKPFFSRSSHHRSDLRPF